MNRTRVTPIVLLTLLGAAACAEVEETGTTPASTEPSTTSTSAADVVNTSAPPVSETVAGDDPLCLAFQAMVDQSDGHLPVEDAEDLETVRTATVEFYNAAVDLVDPPEQDAFSQLLTYEQELYDWSEANEWSPSRELEDVVDNPPPTIAGADVDVVRQVLEDRCQVDIVLE
jgi:hypothetical protein